ncbi:MAG: tRNA preQ1(34) S-adenosylmethionine ribosyltransferase-isomerase QueA, partial [Dehalococcoidia bacterium]
VEPRDSSRLLVLDRRDGSIRHQHFSNIIDYLNPGDVLVFNESRVIPARLCGTRNVTGGKVEILLLKRLSGGKWEALVKPGKRLNTGAIIEIPVAGNILYAKVTDIDTRGIRTLDFSDETMLPKADQIALPPYIHTPLKNTERYQTIYARTEGSVAAPTAGLHFTPELLNTIRDRGVYCIPVTLHVGLDTFQPVREEDPCQHIIHREFGVISEDSARIISQAKIEKRKVFCIGTTAVRTVEYAASISTSLQPFSGWIDLFIIPGYRFRITDAMITNFHLPRTTLLMLVCAFTGKELINKAYAEAIVQKYRFYSFGDAMLII